MAQSLRAAGHGVPVLEPSMGYGSRNRALTNSSHLQCEGELSESLWRGAGVEGTIFRLETTANCPEDFKVHRRKEGE